MIRMSEIYRKIKCLCLKLRDFFPWVLAAITVLSSNWAADAIADSVRAVLREGETVISWPRLGCIAFFMFMILVLYRKRGTFFPPRTRLLKNEDAEKRKHLFLFISSITPETEKTNGIPDNLTLSFNSLGKDLDIIKKQKQIDQKWWKWEMPLRAIYHHLGILDSVTIICSKESLGQAHLFLNICKKYTQLEEINFLLLTLKKGRPEVVDTKLLSHENVFQARDISEFEGLDFENFDQLTDALLCLISKFKHAENDIMIDITGGQKPTSIVGASVTFNQKIKAQYVQTGGENKVRSYDVVLASTDTGSLGL